MILLTLLATLAQPAIVDGQLIQRGAPFRLAEALHGLGDGWGGYAVPRVLGRHQPCGGGVVSLEDGRREERGDAEPGGDVAIFFRVEGGRVTALRVLGTECQVDAGGRSVVWWSSVGEQDSLAFLDALARAANEELADGAVMAIAMHRSEESDSRLEELATSGVAQDTREKAVFWLGAARGVRGLEALSRLATGLDDSELRENVAFALQVSDAAGAAERLVAMAKSDASADVRGKALFWLAQEAGDLATSAIVDAVANDPEVELKEKAVFALSRLPPGKGVPLLIDVAETHPEPRVRKKAMFWLGQSNDPRALALFERILLER